MTNLRRIADFSRQFDRMPASLRSFQVKVAWPFYPYFIRAKFMQNFRRQRCKCQTQTHCGGRPLLKTRQYMER